MAKDHQPFSLLQQNDLFVDKILSRSDSSFGHSARLPACRLPGRIPFNWEAQPGLPKYPSEIPPPPSAAASALLKTPQQDPVCKTWFWKKPKRKGRSTDVVKKNGAFGSSSASRRHVDRESELGTKLNDESSMLSCVSYSNLSPSSSLASSSNGFGRRRFKLGGLVKGFIRWAF